MDEDINNFFQKQAEVLPSEIRKYIISGEWEQNLNTIIQKFKLSEETAGVLGREVMIVLSGLEHPGVFRGEFASDISDIDDATIDAVVADVSNLIFQPIRPALEKFFQEQDSAEEPTPTPVRAQESQKEKEKITIPAPPSLVAPSRVWEKLPEVVPENLPTGEVVVPEVVQNNVPPTLAPVPSEQTHPFEEKMKKVFTGGVVDRRGLVLEQKGVHEQSSGAVPRAAHDPYREPIE